MALPDALGRRSREKAHSSGKRVSPQKRDLLWFQKLHEHGPLSSSYLHAFSQHLARSEKRARDRLTDLFNEKETPHGGAYLERPWQQFQTFDARYQELVYELAPAAEAALSDHGLWHEHDVSAGGPWKHRAMVAAITASIELATLNDPALNFIPQHAILARAKATLRCSVPVTDPKTGKELKSDLIPDALFGIEYVEGNTKSYRFFVVEADRGTEPTRSSSISRKSHLRHLPQYHRYIAGGLYKEHLKLTAPLLVLNVLNSEVTMRGMMALARELYPRGNSVQLFRCAPEFGRYFKPSALLPDLLRGAWMRAEQPPFRIHKA